MPSLRQKVTTYFRQLSFIADGPSRSPPKNDDEEEGNFIIKYLEGRMERIFVAGPEIFHSENPSNLPVLPIGSYPTGPSTISAACTGPDEGLTGIKRSKLHLSASFADDIDFIDTNQEHDVYEERKSIATTPNRPHSKFNRFHGTSKVGGGGPTTPTSDQNANKATAGGMRSRKNSRTSISNLQQAAATSTTKEAAGKASKPDNANKATTIVVSMVSSTSTSTKAPTNDNNVTEPPHVHNNRNLMNAKTELGRYANAKQQSAAATAIATKDDKTTYSDTSKLLEGTTERLLREAVSNQVVPDASTLIDSAVAGVVDWKMESESAYGISVSLYENNMLTKESMGNPIADCYGMVVRGDSAALALADGVNWGDGARLAARSAVHGCLDYLDRAIFGLAQECMATTTNEVFVSLLRALWEGHGCILEVGGALSTLTIAVVLPLKSESEQENGEKTAGKYVVCACNVGDSLGYVYSKKYGVREFTQGSHDITTMRDMRDALGALGPADGNKPELSNLTMSMTVIEKGDIVFLTSDGVSDNFDPVVGKFAEAWTPDVKLMTSSALHGSRGGGVLAPKRQNKSASAIYARLHRGELNKSPMPTPVRPPPRTKKPLMPSPPSENGPAAPSRPKYMRSHTVIEPRRLSSAGNPATRHLHSPTAAIAKVPKSLSGLPLVTGPQRHALTLYRLEDLLSYGINGTFSPCISARRLCHLLIDFVRMITSARRKTLEQRELFYKLATGPDGVRREVELNRMQHRAARKRIVDSSAFVALPGKLDHATVVAYTVGAEMPTQQTTNLTATNSTATTTTACLLHSKEFDETNF